MVTSIPSQRILALTIHSEASLLWVLSPCSGWGRDASAAEQAGACLCLVSLKPPKASDPATERRGEELLRCTQCSFLTYFTCQHRQEVGPKFSMGQEYLFFPLLHEVWLRSTNQMKKNGWYLHQHSPPCTLPIQTGIPSAKRGELGLMLCILSLAYLIKRS